MTEIDRPPDGKSEGRKINAAANSEAILLSSVDDLLAEPEWLKGYPEETRQAIAWQKRRRRASNRMAPLPNGKRDPWDRCPDDGPEAA
jgi:hypothetical protein